MKTNQKHILIVTSEFPPLPGGIGNHAYNLALQLQHRGFNVSVITDQRSKIEDEPFDSNLKLNVFRISITTPRWFMYIKRLHLLLQHIKHVDIVIASGKFSLWMVALSSLFYKRQFIAVIHGSEVNFSNRLLRVSINVALRQFTKVIAVSNYTKELITHLNLNKVVVIPNGFSVSDWDHNEANVADLKGSPKLITVGNVTERKGQLNVIKQLPKLIKIYPNLHYHCVGLETQKKEFLAVAKTLKVEKHITFYGRVKHEQLKAYLQVSDVFVMLSGVTKTGDVEGFGIALLEANYLGLPAIGTVNCGIEDAISNNKSGLLIDYNDGEAFLEALAEILSRKLEFSKAAKLWALQHRWTIIIEKYLEVINK